MKLKSTTAYNSVTNVLQHTSVPSPAAGIINTSGVQDNVNQMQEWTTTQLNKGNSVTWISNPLFDETYDLRESYTKEDILSKFNETLKHSKELTLEDLTDLQGKLFEMIDKVKSSKHVSIDITL